MTPSSHDASLADEDSETARAGLRVEAILLFFISILPLAARSAGWISPKYPLPILLTWMLCWLVFAGLCARQRMDKTHPMFWSAAAILMMYAIHPFAVISSGRIARPYQMRFSLASTYSEASWLGTLATASLILGFLLFRRRGPRLALPIADARQQERLAILARRLGWATVAVAIGGYAIYSVSEGQSLLSGFANGARRTASDSSSAYLYSTPQMLGPAALLILYANHIQKRGNLLVVVLLAAQLLLFLPTGQRYVLLTCVLPVLMAWAYFRGSRIRALVFVPLLIAGLLVVIVLRDAGASGGGTLSASLSNAYSDPGLAVEDFFTGADTEMIDGFAVELQFVPEHVAHQPGLTLMATLAAPIPRVLWPGKPTSSDGVLNYALLGVEQGNASVAYGFLGDLYFDFGWMSVLLGMLLFGAGCAVMRNSWIGSSSPEFAVIYFAFIPLTVSLLRGSLALVAGRGLFVNVSVILFALICARAIRRDAQARRG